MRTKTISTLASVAIALLAVLPSNAQILSGSHGSDDMKIGVAGFSYCNFSIDETLAMLQSMDVKYLSIKDWWLPLDSTKEQMDAFKAKCASYGVEGYILGPIYMKSKEEVDRAFAYTERYGIKMFIGVPDYDLIDYVIQKVAETGIRVAIHTHGPDGAAFPSIYKIMELVKDPSLGVGCCWEMGRGVIDFRPIVKALRKVGYKGVLSVEFEKNGDNPHPGVAESIGYLRGILDGTK